MPVKLEPGLSLTMEKIVPPEWSADGMGNPGFNVFSTPALVGLLDVLARDCVASTLKPGQGSVGAKIDVAHLAPTPIGMKVRARAEVVKIDGKRIVLRIEAYDEQEQIASGTIEHYIISSVEGFLDRVAAKARGERREKPPAGLRALSGMASPEGNAIIKA
jgi:fluoroacetyl-CoA thioesterase